MVQRMILAENKNGQQLLEYLLVSENELIENDIFRPVTGSFAFIKCKDKYLVAYNKWRNQWEFPAGKIENGETYKECAIRELFEETNQHVANLEYRGLFKIYDKNKSEIRYRTVFFAEIDEIAEFKENEEMNKIMLWDLETDIGYFDEIDKKMLQLCLKQIMIENELREYILSLGADLVGVASLSNVDTSAFNNMNYGISFGIKIAPQIIKDINDGPTKGYFEECNKINDALDKIALLCVEHIRSKGFNAVGQTSTYVTSDNNLTTTLPHKTVATRAGLGWIGKNALLVTPEYGSAIRISSVITDMPLITNTPINKSRCGKCTNCVDACPASAINGVLWNTNSKRDELLDPYKCRKKARELSSINIGFEISLCGKCIEVCPFTKRYKAQTV